MSKAIINLMAGFNYLFRALSMMGEKGVRGFIILPLLINVLVFGLLIAVGISYFGDLVSWLLPSADGWLSWLYWLLWIVFGFIALLIIFYTFSLVANIIAAPFNSWLAEAVEYKLTGERPPGDFSSVLKQALPSMLSEVKKLLYLLRFAIPALLLFIIPGVNLLAPFVWLIFNAWALAMEYLDYPMGNHNLLFPQQRKLVAEQRMLNLGLGSAVSLFTLVPIINFIVMPTAVVAATLIWVEHYPSKQPEGDSES